MVYMAIKVKVFYALTACRLADVYEGFLKIFSSKQHTIKSQKTAGLNLCKTASRTLYIVWK